MSITVASVIKNNYMRRALISLSQGKIYAAAQVPTVGPEPDTWGLSISVEPILVTIPTQSQIARVLYESLIIALSHEDPLPINARDSVDLFAAKAGVKTSKQFYEGESSCSLCFFPNRIKISHWKPQKKGYGSDGDGETVLPANSTFEQVAEVVLASLQDPTHIRPMSAKKKSK